jgi:hypothetical protein
MRNDDITQTCCVVVGQQEGENADSPYELTQIGPAYAILMGHDLIGGKPVQVQYRLGDALPQNQPARLLPQFLKKREKEDQEEA